MTRGTLFLVVGPSGAGKDTLMRAARAALAGDDSVLFARRVITRGVPDPSEDFEAVDAATFAARQAAGEFMLHWRAHGFAYGIPADCAAALARGTDVVANVSRTVIAQAAARHAPVCVIEVTAPPEVLAQRLRARGREGAAERGERLARAVPVPSGVRRVRIDNTGTVEEGTRALLAVLGRR